MCGIAGFISLEKFDELQADLPVAATALSHRGPNDAGHYFNKAEGVGLAHRRLSILDLSEAGHQPMFNDDGSLTIVYNGEVYNFKKIRDELKSFGYRFKSGTDTEVIIKAFQHWGAQCLSRFVGMFAIAIWDKSEKRLFIARDRIGIKPLYYYYDNGIFLFGSELKALMAFKSFPRELNPEAIPLFLHYQYIPAPRTIFQNTWKLRPGHFLIFDGKKIDTNVFWECPEVAVQTDLAAFNEETAIEKLDHLITQAVSDRLVSDVPVGALLSGGIDSSLVAAMMQKTSKTAVNTFTIGFPEKQYNEAPWAARIAAHLGTNHTELYVNPEQALEFITEICDYYDEPFADSSAIPTYLVSRLTRSHVTVALSGDGGDEQFAGYVRYWMTRTMADLFKCWPEGGRRIIARFLSRLPVRMLERAYLPIRDKLPQRLQVANFQDKWQKLLNALNHYQICELYRTTINLWEKKDINELTGMELPVSQFEETFKRSDGWPVISQLMYVDQQTYLPDCMLTKVDRASMANGLEIRVPLLDHRVVEFTTNLPEMTKYRNGTGKYLLKRILAQYVPDQLFLRPKMGFGAPMDKWFRKELKGLLLDYLSPARLKREGRFDVALIEKSIHEHLNGTRNHHHRLWALLMWQMWHERWIGKQ